MVTVAKQDARQRKGHDPSEGVGIRVRRAHLTDYPKIEAFIQEAYGELAAFKAHDRWTWQFVNNPYVVSHGGAVPVWIAEAEGKVVGQIAVQHGTIELDGAQHPAGWIVDVMILPSHRGLRLGHRLYEAVARDCPILVTLTMALATRRMAERLGAIDLTEVELYARYLHFDHRTVRRYLRARTVYHEPYHRAAEFLCRYFGIHRVLAATGNAILAARNALFKMPRAKRQTEIIETKSFGPEFDLFWEKMARDYGVAFSRESRFLNWRFGECPTLRYRCFTAWREGSAVGYMVLRQTEAVELPEGVIVDLLAGRDDQDTIEDLVAFALDYFADKQVAAVECATSIPEFAAVLRRFGFHSVDTEKPNCVVADPEVRKKLESLSSAWLFSKADHDWDQIHLA